MLFHTAACREVWEFLSAWSELYGITADAGFLRSVSQKIQGANNSVRRYGQTYITIYVLLAQESGLPNTAGCQCRDLQQMPSCVKHLGVSCQQYKVDKGCSSMCLSNSLKLTAHACFPRAMGDIVEEMDSHRRKSFALLTRKGADGRAEGDYSEHPPLSRASRSFSRVRALLYLPQVHEEPTVMTVFVPHVHEKLH